MLERTTGEVKIGNRPLDKSCVLFDTYAFRQVTLGWQLELVVWGIETLVLVDGKWETAPETSKLPIQTTNQREADFAGC